MIANALILTIALLLALGFWLMGELKFLIPYRHILVSERSRAHSSQGRAPGVRVVLDFELKKRINHDFAKFGT
jgi:hypothetical protein